MPDSLILTEEERKRFSAYCLNEANTLDGLTEQMRKINIPEAVIRHRKAIAMAYRVVAGDLSKLEVE